MRIAVLVLGLGGCAMGGRLTGGVLAGERGVTGFASATFELGVVDRELARLTAELGGTVSDQRPATHVGLRYQPRRDGRTGFTIASAIELSDDGAFGQVTAGVSIHQAALTGETPDVLSGNLLGIDLEAVADLGGRDVDDLAPALGVQLSAELLHFSLMR